MAAKQKRVEIRNYLSKKRVAILTGASAVRGEESGPKETGAPVVSNRESGRESDSNEEQSRSGDILDIENKPNQPNPKYIPVQTGPPFSGETGPDEDKMSPEEHSAERKGLLCGLRSYKLKDVFTWQLFKTIAMGQGLSALICGTAVTSQYLATDFQMNTPMLQSFLNYSLLCLTYTTILIFRRGDGNILQILKSKWWKYFLLGLTDVEANYTVVKAYQYTTLTSIQLLDCFVIPVLMVLSWFFLKTRYRPVHYIAVVVCLGGVGAMVGADLIAGRDQGSSANILLGDGLVLISATLYAVSNVCQEYTVKNLSRVEFLGMVGLFGTLISGIQMAILEHNELANIQWKWEQALLLAGFALCMYILYSIMPVVVKMTSATAVNLSLLTADLFSLFCGLFLFHYSFSVLYIVSLLVILVGFIMFNAVPTFTLNPATVPEPQEDGYQGSVFEVTSSEPVTPRGEGEDCDSKGLTWKQPMYNQSAISEERATRL